MLRSSFHVIKVLENTPAKLTLHLFSSHKYNSVLIFVFEINSMSCKDSCNPSFNIVHDSLGSLSQIVRSPKFFDSNTSIRWNFTSREFD